MAVRYSWMFYGLLSLIFLLSCAKPVADFIINQEDLVAPATVSFLNNSKDASVYVWDTGVDTTYSNINVSQKYFMSGRYDVKLMAYKGSKVDTCVKTIFIDAPQNCLIDIETTKGNIIIELFDDTPLHRDNFLALASSGFYEGTIFHRVISSFMIQGGDPESKKEGSTSLGTGGPNYLIPSEFNPYLFHTKGAVAAARTGGPGNPEKKSSGSQFYIVHGRKYSLDELSIFEAQKNLHYDESSKETYMKIGGAPQLDLEYTVFGRVVKGLETVDRIASVQTNCSDRPIEDVRIL